ncbi:MAG: adenylosuccinate lyase [bacterium]|nr:adenylosuccinate lyase [bacterium]
MPNPHDTYTSPLAARNASPEMCKIWSPRHKFTTWRKIWLAVAEAQQACGLDISDEQLDEMRATLEVTDEDMEAAAKYERELRHDVMAHVHAWGDRCPKARPIIHLGCTSQDVVCNGDLMVQYEAIGLIESKITRAVLSLGESAAESRSVPTLGFTHYQPAQPVTVGRRTAGWANELYQCSPANRDEYLGSMYRLRGFGGATGTQASFLNLFENDPERVDRFEMQAVSNLLIQMGVVEDDSVAEAVGTGIRDAWMFQLMGQTYPRSQDAALLASLANVASVLHKIATDIRLLSNRKEIDEPFGKSQIGSSAMPYKRNPMKCERICGLTRFVMNLVGNAYDTAATQWLERTLDDSSNRRLSLPEAFLALDGALDLMHTVASGLIVNEAMVKRNLMAELPFMATENIMMEAVKLGRDRQDVHEAIRVLSHEAGYAVKQEGKDNDLLDRLKSEPLLEGVDIDAHLDPMQYVGRSVEQTERFIKEVVEPLRERYGDQFDALGSADRGV